VTGEEATVTMSFGGVIVVGQGSLVPDGQWPLE
jgi:hypothetical protein